MENQLQTFIGRIEYKNYGVCDVHHDGNQFIISNRDLGVIKKTKKDMIQEILKYIQNENKKEKLL